MTHWFWSYAVVVVQDLKMPWNGRFEAMSTNDVLKVAFPGVGVEGRDADHFCVLLGVWGVQLGVEIDERRFEVLVGILPLDPPKVSSAFRASRKFVASSTGGTISY